MNNYTKKKERKEIIKEILLKKNSGDKKKKKNMFIHSLYGILINHRMHAVYLHIV